MTLKLYFPQQSYSLTSIQTQNPTLNQLMVLCDELEASLAQVQTGGRKLMESVVDVLVEA